MVAVSNRALNAETSAAAATATASVVGARRQQPGVDLDVDTALLQRCNPGEKRGAVCGRHGQDRDLGRRELWGDAARRQAIDDHVEELGHTAAVLRRHFENRLDAQAEIASPAVQQGLITRLAYAEAAGWLASQGITAHPVSLALRASERTGRRELWLQQQALRPARSVPAWEQDDAWLAADE